MLDPVPEGSIYLWMYVQGIKRRDLAELTATLLAAGKGIREKDVRNYWNGWYRSGHREMEGSPFDLAYYKRGPEARESFLSTCYEDYPDNPYNGMPEIRNRWVPCSKNGLPIIRWGNGGYTVEMARAVQGCRYLAENLRGTRTVVLDVDGDHGTEVDTDVIATFWKYRDATHRMDKPDSEVEVSGMRIPSSYHLTFYTDKVIPRFCSSEANLDILGNKNNGLRFFKDKIWNGLPPAPMTPGIWEDIQRYIARRTQGNPPA